ncbi:riboflavin synthase [Rhodovibrio salinarum]|uniref:Riboflavin synthase n=1 Tax=Rhodovibrio salinarum TaxID=1087 RepID=A0A934V0W5_9PROT|nr:riboflavin synthase [Rhodovibrio salinarum]MBK1697930.1 riboflavin synthase [Rhodovibrio salinarum]
MFTGIVTDVGRVRAVQSPPEGEAGDLRFVFDTAYDPATLALGASVCCAGVCLTVVETHAQGFAVDVSAETLSKTTLGDWDAGTPVNLERSLRMGDELGGHLVYGHVDALARVVDAYPEGDSWRYLFEVPQALAQYVAPKGSIALDGVSLTVNEVEGNRFGVNIIPHTRDVTTFGQREAGSLLNCEIDMLARYVARMLAAGGEDKE